jgi:AraC-like DNA-binding protein
MPATILFDVALRDIDAGTLVGRDQRWSSCNLATCDLAESLAVAQVVVMAARRDGGFGSARLVQRIRAVAPHVAVYVVTPESSIPGGELLQLAQLWTDDVFFLARRDEMERLAESIRLRLRVPPPERALRAAARLIHGYKAAPIVMLTLVTAHRRPPIAQIAARFRCSDRTLIRALDNEQLPQFGELRRLGEYLCALELHVSHGRRLGEAARRMGLTDTKLFSRARRWCEDTRPSQFARHHLAGLAFLYSHGIDE